MYNYFQTLSAYNPVYTSFEGGIYEMALTRACIHTFANHISKLKPVVNGSANAKLNNTLQYKPNPYMDTKKYLYRLATIYKVDNNAFIVPMYADNGLRDKIIGFYPVCPSQVDMVQAGDDPAIRYSFASGESATIELSRTGLLNQYQYKDDFWGDTNYRSLRPTLDLLNAQNQSIINGVKQSASIRFLAKLAGAIKPADIESERKRFNDYNLGAENSNGVLIFDQKYEDIKQINSQMYVVDDKQSALIRESVFDFFGMSENILQNKFKSDEWAAYYEGQIEPFAIELSLVHTNMTFDERERAFGNEIIFSVNRLQYLAPSEKLQVATQLFDRGMLNADGGREIFQLDRLPNNEGEKYYIRREYAEINALNGGEDTNAGETESGISHNAVDGDPAVEESAE